jgi:N12 class adenine-specific DNA methylase
MYLTNATLIVIPVNLLSQWESEMNKHCDSQCFLRVLVLQKEVALPSAKIMASNYDVGILYPLDITLLMLTDSR